MEKKHTNYEPFCICPFVCPIHSESSPPAPVQEGEDEDEDIYDAVAKYREATPPQPVQSKICNCPFQNPSIAIADNCPIHSTHPNSEEKQGVEEAAKERFGVVDEYWFDDSNMDYVEYKNEQEEKQRAFILGAKWQAKQNGRLAGKDNVESFLRSKGILGKTQSHWFIKYPDGKAVDIVELIKEYTSQLK